MRSTVLFALVASSCAPAALDATASSVTPAKMTALADESVDVAVTLIDTAGQPVRADFTVEVSGSENVVGGPTSTGKDGRATFNFRSPKAEAKTVSVTAQGVALAPVQLSVVAGPLQALRFTTQPSSARVGEVLRPPVVVGGFDAKGNPITTSDVITVSVRLVRSSGGVVSGGSARPLTMGAVTFEALTIDRAQTGYALRAESNGGAAVESALFDVTP